MENGREVRSTSLKYDDGQKATNSAAVRRSYPLLPLSGLVQQNLSVTRIGKKKGQGRETDTAVRLSNYEDCLAS
jgi:hypothetical protein